MNSLASSGARELQDRPVRGLLRSGTRRHALAAVALSLLAASCSSSTKMVRSWTPDDFHPGSVKKVFVVGIAKDRSLRQIYEDAFVAEIKKRGAQAGVSYDSLPDLDQVDKSATAARLINEGYTHVLVTRVVNMQQHETYVPPTTVSFGVGYGGYPGYYGGWYPYMSASYGYVTSPGYVTTQTVVSLETNVYALTSEAMVYSGMSETWLSDTPSGHVPEVIATVSYNLRAKGVL